MKRVWQKLCWESNDSFVGGWGGGGGEENFTIAISLFSGFQKAEFHHEAEQFHPCNEAMSNTTKTTLIKLQ